MGWCISVLSGLWQASGRGSCGLSGLTSGSRDPGRSLLVCNLVFSKHQICLMVSFGCLRTHVMDYACARWPRLALSSHKSHFLWTCVLLVWVAEHLPSLNISVSLVFPQISGFCQRAKALFGVRPGVGRLLVTVAVSDCADV